MKMVKSLLLGSAAGLVAVAGAQAADLPVKAKPVEYVKICSAYGAGYFYIPGTDTCLKIGGYARFDTYVNDVGTFRPAIMSTAKLGFDGPGRSGFAYPFTDGDDPDYMTRARGVFDMDARTQTDYGTLRSYVRFGGEWNSQSAAGAGPNNGLYFERAFVQFAGFTFGYTQSFFDLGSNYMMTTPVAGSNTWTSLIAYTAQFGNGFSASIALEDAANRTTGAQGSTATAGSAAAANRVWFGSIGPFGTNTFVNVYEGAGSGLGYQNWQGGQTAPDIVANLRVDQAWGTAMISGALHQVNVEVPVVGGGGFPIPGTSTSDQWGWALGATAEFKLPMVGAGDSLLLQANYAKGAINYAGMSANVQGTANAWGRVSIGTGGSLSGAYVPLADAVLTAPFGDFDLTTAWSLLGEFRHYWTPGLRSVIFGGYTSYDVPDNTAVAAVSANLWQIGTDLIWSPVKNLDLGLELTYSKVESDVPLQVAGALQANGFTSIIGGSTDVWSGGFRAQRNF